MGESVREKAREEEDYDETAILYFSNDVIPLNFMSSISSLAQYYHIIAGYLHLEVKFVVFG